MTVSVPMGPGPMMGGPQGFMGPMINGQGGPTDGSFQMPNLILPGMNDSPLEFNMNKNKPPMPVENSNGRDDRRDSPNDRNRRNKNVRKS